MIRFSKTTQCAVAALSRLAEIYDDGQTVLSSAEIARSRNLPKPLVAKLLTILSQAGLINGRPGPGGGYCLARSPREICLYDVTQVFESEQADMCPFSPVWCGHGDPCPLHEPLLKINEQMAEFLKGISLEALRGTV